MRNRAKCKLCSDILESLGPRDFVTCSCGEITIGPDLYAAARNWDNFFRIDDNDHEIHVQYQDKREKHDQQINEQEETHKPTKDELIVMLDEMIKSYEHLPLHAMLAPISHADQLSLLMLVSSLFKSI